MDRLMESAPPPTFCRYQTSATKAQPDSGAVFARKNLQKIGVIGHGGFGSFELCQNKESKDIHVLKTMSKGLLVQKGFRTSIMREKMLWSGLSSPYILQLFATYNEEQSLSFLVEAALGGELSRTYQKYNLYGSDQHAKFYTSAASSTGVCDPRACSSRTTASRSWPT